MVANAMVANVTATYIWLPGLRRYFTFEPAHLPQRWIMSGPKNAPNAQIVVIVIVIVIVTKRLPNLLPNSRLGNGPTYFLDHHTSDTAGTVYHQFLHHARQFVVVKVHMYSDANT